jgi:two-component system, OmpR family, phosphate regulon sensor histidine kinase PhoR
MTQTNPTPAAASNLPWFGGAGIVGGVCGGLAFIVTGEAATALILGAIIVFSLVFGWMSARWFSVDQEQEPQIGIDSGAASEAQSEIGSQAIRFARKAIEATPNPVILLDRNGVIISTNQAARTRFDIKLNRARFANIIRRPDLLEAVETVLSTRAPMSLAIETRLPVDRFERASIAAFDVSGVPFVIISISDETEVRMSERMRADFLANASHELRTPLAAIIGFIETLRGPAREDEVARDRFLEVMGNQADRMSRLISDLLSLSRIELNEHVPPTGLSDIAAAVYEAVDGLQPAQKQRIELDVKAHPIWVQGDRDEMAQVVINLIDNALKYSDPVTKVRIIVANDLVREAAVTAAMRQWDGAARLPLTSPAIERDRLYGIVRVENSGDGIERQHLPRLSERFFRIEDSASGKSGTGLGLAIVKHIVSRHRGGLTVESELGRGSAFCVYLPQPNDADQVASGTRHAATPAGANLIPPIKNVAASTPSM